MMLIDLACLLAALVITPLVIYAVLQLVYRRGRQVDFRIGRGSATGRVLGTSGFKLRVRSLHSGNEHTVALTHVRRR